MHVLTEEELEELGRFDGPWVRGDWDGLVALVSRLLERRGQLPDSMAADADGASSTFRVRFLGGPRHGTIAVMYDVPDEVSVGPHMYARMPAASVEDTVDYEFGYIPAASYGPGPEFEVPYKRTCAG